MDKLDQENTSQQAVPITQGKVSLVWIVPIIAATIAAWLGIVAWANRGVEISITFDTANGLIASKTKVKYKNVEVGYVKEIVLNTETKKVDVHIEMDRSTKSYLKDQTRFWVIKARIAAGGVSGLDTLLTGAYIGIDPSENGKETKQFVGLEKPPGVSKETKGKHFVLNAQSLGSIEEGSPIYFRKFTVGQVESVKLDESGNSVTIQIFVESPYDKWVSENTNFWNSSGVNFSLDPNGFKLNTESLTSVMVGGISFESLPVNKKNPLAKNMTIFTLHETKNELTQGNYDTGVRYLLNFPNSLRGLTEGSPVEFRGLQIGKVEEIQISYDYKTNQVETPIIINLSLKKLQFKNSGKIALKEFKNERDRIDFFINNGARAQLKNGNILTGKLFIDIEFMPKAEKFLADQKSLIPEFPTVPTAIDKIADTLQGTLVKADGMITQFNEMAYKLNHTVVKELSASIKQANKTLMTMDELMQENSFIQKDLQNVIVEFSSAARSIKSMADYLERHPESLINGKKER